VVWGFTFRVGGCGGVCKKERNPTTGGGEASARVNGEFLDAQRKGQSHFNSGSSQEGANGSDHSVFGEVATNERGRLAGGG